MKVLVDTDVWSEALRKRKGRASDEVRALVQLVEERRVELAPFVRMEILCGLRDGEVFERIREYLAAFPDRELTSEAYVLAARYFNRCRSKGIQGSQYDFLLCACSVLWGMPILTKDKDFRHYARHLPIRLMDVNA